MNTMKETIIKDRKLTYNGDEWNAWDKVQNETTEKQREEMSLQDFLIAINEAEKTAEVEQRGEHKEG